VTAIQGGSDPRFEGVRNKSITEWNHNAGEFVKDSYAERRERRRPWPATAGSCPKIEGIGQRLQTQYRAVEEPIPERLAALLKQLEEPAGVGSPVASRPVAPEGPVALPNAVARDLAETTSDETRAPVVLVAASQASSRPEIR
jgi:Anti-sigma factor NepR